MALMPVVLALAGLGLAMLWRRHAKTSMKLMPGAGEGNRTLV
jgi:hypothetical protein